MATLEVTPRSIEALFALIDHQLAKGMVFLPDAGGVEPLTSCALIVTFEGRSHTVLAEIVYVRDDGPGRGVGLQLPPLDDEMLVALRALADPASAQPVAPIHVPLPDLADMPLPDLADMPLPLADEGAPSEDEPDDDTDDGDADEARAPQLHERVRSLSSAEQQRMAATGTLQERTMLERLYGPNVWEALISSGRLSPPEVARIARKGTVPRPILEAIGSNGAWLQSTLVQRALLGNPRCPTTLAQRVLSAMPKRDLQLVPQQTAYPAPIRQAAKAMLKR
ncbi:MAG: hypothetical protein J0L92_32245 [Deltaproteobacteria bacterium]|nr:hypothetical protein [Deltaproteobacteria bacterium]